MEFVSALTGLGGSLLTSAIRAGLSGPVNSLNAFMNKVSSAATAPIAGLNKELLSQANPYAKQNVFERMQALPESVISCDWIAAVLGPSQEIPWEYIDTFQSPSIDVQVHEHRVNATLRRTASTKEFGSITLGLYTDINGTSMNWALSWLRRIHRADGYYSLPVDYYRDVVLFMLDAKRKTVIDFRFKDCFPTSMSGYDMDTGSNLVQTQLTLAVNDVVVSSDNDLTAASQRIGSLFPQIPSVIGFGG